MRRYTNGIERPDDTHGSRASSETEREWRCKGTFILTVNAVGVTRTHTFLDSAANYRARNNLAIAMTPKVAAQVAAQLGTPLRKLKHQRIVVSGVAKRVPIYLLRNGKISPVQYYQTWVRVTSPAQVRFAR